MNHYLKNIVLAIMIMGCATPGVKTHGSFIEISDHGIEIISQDAAKQMNAIFPPAQVRIQMEHQVDDQMGSVLIEELRRCGYEIYEGQAQPETVPMFYVLDSVGDDLHHLTITVGQQQLSRSYLSKGGSFYPAGCWTHRDRFNKE
jgi:type IV secretion system protein TrbH